MDRAITNDTDMILHVAMLQIIMHSSKLLLTFWYMNHKNIKEKNRIHVTIDSCTIGNRVSGHVYM
jgi:hypothetical protein